MDSNKLAKLKEIQYNIGPTCGNCAHSCLTGDWGTCNLHSYEHQKHSDSERQLSINSAGSCVSHEFRQGFNVEGFTIFVSGRK